MQEVKKKKKGSRRRACVFRQQKNTVTPPSFFSKPGPRRAARPRRPRRRRHGRRGRQPRQREHAAPGGPFFGGGASAALPTRAPLDDVPDGRGRRRHNVPRPTPRLRLQLARLPPCITRQQAERRRGCSARPGQRVGGGQPPRVHARQHFVRARQVGLAVQQVEGGLGDGAATVQGFLGKGARQGRVQADVADKAAGGDVEDEACRAGERV